MLPRYIWATPRPSPSVSSPSPAPARALASPPRLHGGDSCTRHRRTHVRALLLYRSPTSQQSPDAWTRTPAFFFSLRQVVFICLARSAGAESICVAEDQRQRAAYRGACAAATDGTRPCEAFLPPPRGKMTGRRQLPCIRGLGHPPVALA